MNPLDEHDEPTPDAEPDAPNTPEGSAKADADEAPQASSIPAEPGDEYERVENVAKGFKGCVRACEAEAASKTASDYAHIVWAYGVIWAVFAVYGVMLWRRAVKQQADMDELKRRIERFEG